MKKFNRRERFNNAAGFNLIMGTIAWFIFLITISVIFTSQMASYAINPYEFNPISASISSVFSLMGILMLVPLLYMIANIVLLLKKQTTIAGMWSNYKFEREDKQAITFGTVFKIGFFIILAEFLRSATCGITMIVELVKYEDNGGFWWEKWSKVNLVRNVNIYTNEPQNEEKPEIQVEKSTIKNKVEEKKENLAINNDIKVEIFEPKK